MEKDENQTGYTLENGNMGQVQIADEVVAIIAGLAATEVEALPAWQAISQTNWSANWQEEPVKRDPCKGRRRYCKCKCGTQHCIWIQRTEDLQKGSGKGKSSDREYDRS